MVFKGSYLDTLGFNYSELLHQSLKKEVIKQASLLVLLGKTQFSCVFLPIKPHHFLEHNMIQPSVIG